MATLDLSFTKSSIFNHPQDYSTWKSSELQSLQEKIDSEAHSSTSPINHFLSLSILEGKGIKSKAKNGVHHTYLKVYHDGQVYTSPLFMDSLEPKWNFDLFIPIRKKSGTILITVWLLSDEKKDLEEGNPFLGSIILSGDDLSARTTEETTETWTSLGKRSSRSHVSGQILIRTARISLSKDSLEKRKIFAYLPNDPQTCFDKLFRDLMTKHFDEWQKGIDTPSKLLCNRLSSLWRIPKDYQIAMYAVQLRRLTIKACST